MAAQELGLLHPPSQLPSGPGLERLIKLSTANQRCPLEARLPTGFQKASAMGEPWNPMASTPTETSPREDVHVPPRTLAQWVRNRAGLWTPISIVLINAVIPSPLQASFKETHL